MEPADQGGGRTSDRSAQGLGEDEVAAEDRRGEVAGTEILKDVR